MRWYLSSCTVLLLWRILGLPCSISRTTWAAASRTSTSRSAGRIPTPVGVGILQAHFNLHEPFACFLLLSGETPTQSGIYNSTFQADARLHAVTKWTATVGGSKDLTPILLPHLYSWFPLSLPAGWREQRSGPTPAQHQGRRRSVRWTECVTSPSGREGACQASFLTRHTQCPQHKKVSDDTNSETHTCTKHNTDTSGNPAVHSNFILRCRRGIGSSGFQLGWHSTDDAFFSDLGTGRIQTHGSICSGTKPACRSALLSFWCQRSRALIRPYTAFRSLCASSGPKFDQLLRSNGVFPSQHPAARRI